MLLTDPTIYQQTVVSKSARTMSMPRRRVPTLRDENLPFASDHIQLCYIREAEARAGFLAAVYVNIVAECSHACACAAHKLCPALGKRGCP